MSRPRFLPKGIVSLYEKTLNFNPALFWESRSIYLCHSFCQLPRPSAKQAEPSPKQSGAFFQLKYTFDYQGAKMNEAKKF